MTDIILLDGGMGQELVQRAGDKPTALWSTQIMIDHPGMVAGVHADFYSAGATIATANSYAIHRDRLAKTEMEGRFFDLHAMAIAEAKAATVAHGSGQIAGAIGPLGASYRPDLHPETNVAVRLFAEVAEQLVDNSELIIGETIASIAHAQDFLTATKPLGKPVWLALTLDDSDGTRLRSGEPVASVLPVIESGVDAILINCCTPEVIPDALKIIGEVGIPYGAYANGFEHITDEFLRDSPTVDTLNLRRDFTPKLYADHVMGWIDQGATIVGGCCEVGPTHIAEIAEQLRVAGHQIV